MRIALVLLVLAALGGVMHLRGRDAGALHPGDPRIGTGEQGIVMLAAEWCGYCQRQRTEFALAEVRYQVLDIDTPEGDRAMRALGARGVPVTVIGQSVVRGYDTAALDAALSPLGYRVY